MNNSNRNLKSRGKVVENAGSEFRKINDKVNQEIVKGLAQLSYFAAGIISLSITFLGYIFGQEPVVVKKVFANLMIFSLEMPLLSVLFFSWAFLFFTVLIGLLFRFWNAYYLHFEAVEYWSRSEYDFINEAVKAKEQELANVKFTEDPSKGLEIRKSILDKSKKKRIYYAWLVVWGRKVAISSFVLGLFFLIIFAMVATRHLLSTKL